LHGPPGNLAAVGATLRLGFGQRGERLGPARELHAGSGYWSQDSLVQVLAAPEPPSRIWVHWPGGATTTTPLPSGAHEIVVAASGELNVLR
jgi:hypothetical protein